MNTKELIHSYKSDYTPLDENAKILRFYTKNVRSTNPFGSYREIIIRTITNKTELPFITTIEDFWLENKERQFIKLYSEFLVKWSKHKANFSTFGQAFVFDKIKIVIDRFLTLRPSYITFDLTDDCSVFFQALVGGKNIYLELFFTSDVEEDVEAILNVYQNRECVFAYGGTIENTFSKITSIVKKDYYADEPTRTDYDLSGTPIAATTF